MFKNFLTIPLKATIFEKYKFFLCPPLYTMVTLHRFLEKPVAGRTSPEKTGLYFSTCLSWGGADRRQQICGLTVPVPAAIVKLQSPGGRLHTIKIGWWAFRISIKKLSTACTGYQFKGIVS
jgi:hypothetical protein